MPLAVLRVKDLPIWEIDTVSVAGYDEEPRPMAISMGSNRKIILISYLISYLKHLLLLLAELL